MRRKDKEITDTKEIERIILSSQVCRLAMCSNDKPIPLCFGYENKEIFLHSANKGKKIDILTTNANELVLSINA